MRNLKVLSIALMCGLLVLAWCEKTNNQEPVSCEGDDTCPIEIDVDTPSVEIEQVLDVIDEWNLEADTEEEIVFENNEQVNEEPVDEPMMRKMVVDEDATEEEIEEDMVNTCANAGWTWADWTCTLEDGSTIAF